MAQLMPPPPPPLIIASDDDRRQRLQFRLWQLLMSTITVLLAVWFSTFGVVSAVLAWVVAKHVLVAILMMGLHYYPRFRGETEPRTDN